MHMLILIGRPYECMGKSVQSRVQGLLAYELIAYFHIYYCWSPELQGLVHYSVGGKLTTTEVVWHLPSERVVNTRELHLFNSSQQI